MKKFPLYRFRFWAGFFALGIFAIFAAAWNFWRLPNGLGASEMDFAARAAHLDFATILSGHADIANLPALLLTRFSTDLFGFSTFALRLPSVTFALVALGIFVALTAKFLRKNVAIVAGFLAASTPLFLSIARAGNGDSFAIFLLFALIFVAAILARARFSGAKSVFLKILLCALAALLAYSPGGIFVAFALALVGLVQPKSRYEIFRNRWWTFAIGAAVGFLLALPLLLSVARVGSDLVLLGISRWNFAHFGGFVGAFFALGGIFAGFVAPVMNVAVVALVLFGLCKLGGVVSSSRATLILALSLLAIILALGDANLLFWLFAPAMLALAVGVGELLTAWFSLFPRNPYARIFGLALVILLTAGVAAGSLYAYIFANFYEARVVRSLDREFEAARNTLDRGAKSQILVAPKSREKFYAGLERDFPNLKIANSVPKKFAKNELIVLASSQIPAKNLPTPTSIAPDFVRENPVLLRKY